MSNLGLNSKVKEKFAKKTVEDEVQVIGNLGIKDELELLNKTYKSILFVQENAMANEPVNTHQNESMKSWTSG